MSHKTIITALLVMAAILTVASCTNRPMPSEEKEYPEALFTLGKISTVELEMPEETWQTIIKKASVLGQMNGTVPSTWDAQKAEPRKLINSDDIKLQDLGGI